MDYPPAPFGDTSPRTRQKAGRNALLNHLMTPQGKLNLNAPSSKEMPAATQKEIKAASNTSSFDSIEDFSSSPYESDSSRSRPVNCTSIDNDGHDSRQQSEDSVLTDNEVDDSPFLGPRTIPASSMDRTVEASPRTLDRTVEASPRALDRTVEASPRTIGSSPNLGLRALNSSPLFPSRPSAAPLPPTTGFSLIKGKSSGFSRFDESAPVAQGNASSARNKLLSHLVVGQSTESFQSPALQGPKLVPVAIPLFSPTTKPPSPCAEEDDEDRLFTPSSSESDLNSPRPSDLTMQARGARAALLGHLMGPQRSTRFDSGEYFVEKETSHALSPPSIPRDLEPEDVRETCAPEIPVRPASPHSGRQALIHHLMQVPMRTERFDSGEFFMEKETKKSHLPCGVAPHFVEAPPSNVHLEEDAESPHSGRKSLIQHLMKGGANLKRFDSGEYFMAKETHHSLLPCGPDEEINPADLDNVAQVIQQQPSSLGPTGSPDTARKSLIHHLMGGQHHTQAFKRFDSGEYFVEKETHHSLLPCGPEEDEEINPAEGLMSVPPPPPAHPSGRSALIHHLMGGNHGGFKRFDSGEFFVEKETHHSLLPCGFEEDPEEPPEIPPETFSPLDEAIDPVEFAEDFVLTPVVLENPLPAHKALMQHLMGGQNSRADRFDSGEYFVEKETHHSLSPWSKPSSSSPAQLPTPKSSGSYQGRNALIHHLMGGAEHTRTLKRFDSGEFFVEKETHHSLIPCGAEFDTEEAPEVKESFSLLDETVNPIEINETSGPAIAGRASLLRHLTSASRHRERFDSAEHFFEKQTHHSLIPCGSVDQQEEPILKEHQERPEAPVASAKNGQQSLISHLMGNSPNSRVSKRFDSGEYFVQKQTHHSLEPPAATRHDLESLPTKEVAEMEKTSSRPVSPNPGRKSLLQHLMGVPSPLSVTQRFDSADYFVEKETHHSMVPCGHPELLEPPSFEDLTVVDDGVVLSPTPIEPTRRFSDPKSPDFAKKLLLQRLMGGPSRYERFDSAEYFMEQETDHSLIPCGPPEDMVLSIPPPVDTTQPSNPTVVSQVGTPPPSKVSPAAAALVSRALNRAPKRFDSADYYSQKR